MALNLRNTFLTSPLVWKVALSKKLLSRQSFLALNLRKPFLTSPLVWKMALNLRNHLLTNPLVWKVALSKKPVLLSFSSLTGGQWTQKAHHFKLL